MKKIRPNGLLLFALCVVLCGCGGDEADTSQTPESIKPEQGPIKTEMVVESSEPTLTKEGEPIDAMGVVEQLLANSNELVAAGYHAQFDREYQREGQRLISVTPMNPVTPDQAATDQAADETFAALKAAFDAYAKQATVDELAYQQALAETETNVVKELQRALQVFQESRRGLPQTDASRLERRTLERQIETTLQSQIEANKRIDSLKKRIDRERFVTLLRVR